MKEQRKLQVFLSSTFTDMRDERQAAVEAILEAGHIPAGMELFAANNETQWITIKKWIDDSSAFLLVLGGRYGTIDNKTGKSYIEMEFQYARSTKKEVLALVMSDAYLKAKETKFLRGASGVEQISQLAEVQNPEKLHEFRKLVRTGRIAPECNSLEELKRQIILSLTQISAKENLAAWILDTPELRNARAISTMKSNLNAHKYGIKILSPAAGTKFKGGLGNLTIEVTGTYEIKPPPNTIFRLFIKTNEPLSYWRHPTVVKFDENEHKWYGKIDLWKGMGTHPYDAYIVAAVLDEIDEAMVGYAAKVQRETNKNIPFDTLPCHVEKSEDEVLVYRE
ncbi:MAG TPA: DUF4062 domain-containing protein [Anaerolineales bacterium]|nr:DUF4062 domain-containing protein [Anaerolineales bacterium]